MFPCSLQRAGQKIFVSECETHVRGAIAAPSTLNRDEHFGEFFDEGGLLLGCEHQVAVALFAGRESGEDSAANAEVGTPHMGIFFGAFEAEGDAAEVVDVHGKYWMDGLP